MNKRQKKKACEGAFSPKSRRFNGYKDVRRDIDSYKVYVIFDVKWYYPRKKWRWRAVTGWTRKTIIKRRRR